MAIKTNLTNLKPARETYSQEIRLLSAGFSAPQAWPGGKLTVYPYDSEVTDYLIRESKKGNRRTLLFRVLPKLCNLNGADWKKMCLGDVTTILLVSKAITQQNKVSYEATCPHCSHKAIEEITVPDDLEKVGEKPDDYVGYDDIVLPVTKDPVRLRPLLVEDEFRIIDRDDAAKRIVSDMIMHIVMPVTHVGGPEYPVSNLMEAFNWYRALPPMDQKYLEDQEDKLYPHLDTRLAHQCEECGKEFTETLDIDADFFRSGRLPTEDKQVAEAVRSSVVEEGTSAGPDKGSRRRA